MPEQIGLHGDHGPARGSRFPSRNLAIVTCMDARIDVFGLLALEQGDAHVIRNAGGVVTDDVIRSLSISQRALGTRHVVVVHHTDCGMTSLTSEAFNRALEEETGVRPAWSAEAFLDPVEETRQSIQRLARSPFVTGTAEGMVWDVGAGELLRVVPSQPIGQVASAG
jgi:carbonic anhydrase